MNHAQGSLDSRFRGNDGRDGENDGQQPPVPLTTSHCQRDRCFPVPLHIWGTEQHPSAH